MHLFRGMKDVGHMVAPEESHITLARPSRLHNAWTSSVNRQDKRPLVVPQRHAPIKSLHIITRSQFSFLLLFLNIFLLYFIPAYKHSLGLNSE